MKYYTHKQINKQNHDFTLKLCRTMRKQVFGQRSMRTLSADRPDQPAHVSLSATRISE